MHILKRFVFKVQYIDSKERVCYRYDTELATYLAGAIRKWQQNNSNAVIIGIVEA